MSSLLSQLAAGKVGFHFAESNIYLLGNDNDGDARSQSARELLRNANSQDTSGNNKKELTPGVIVSIFENEYQYDLYAKTT